MQRGWSIINLHTRAGHRPVGTCCESAHGARGGGGMVPPSVMTVWNERKAVYGKKFWWVVTLFTGLKAGISPQEGRKTLVALG